MEKKICFDTIEIGEVYTCRISHIYDLTKFYVVFLHKELNLHQSYLINFYIDNEKKYKLAWKDVKINRKCVVLVNNGYYRGSIVNIPSFGVSSRKVMVLLFDYGCVLAVPIKDLFSLEQKFAIVPAFAVRASLYGVQPYNTYMWPSEAVQMFNTIVNDKVIVCSVEAIDTEQNTLYINLFEKESDDTLKDITQVLLEKKFAKSTDTAPTYEGDTKTSLVPKIKYPYLFPSFHAIETGEMPPTVEITEYLKDNASWLSYWEPYYTLYRY